MSLKKTIKYPYLPDGKEIKYVLEDNEFMQRAKYVRDNFGTEKRWPTGAVIVKEGKIIGESANYAGFVNSRLIELHAKGFCVRKLLKIKSGQKYWLCPGCSNCKDHAEARAIKNSVKRVGSQEVRGADLYLYGHWWCCKDCWNAMIKAGIKNVFLQDKSWEEFQFTK